MHLVLIVAIALLSVVWLLRRKNPDKDGTCDALAALPAVPGALPVLGNFHQVDKRRIDISMVNWAGSCVQGEDFRHNMGRGEWV